MPAVSPPRAAEYRSQARAAGLMTNIVDYPVAARFCVAAFRLRVRPTAFTLANLVLGVGTAVIVVALADAVASDRRLALLVGVLAWVGWQIAYCCDCADGQLARVTGASSAAGGRLDVLCDVAVQVGVVAAVAAVAQAAGPVPAWLVAAFAGTWMVNMVTSVMAKEGTGSSLVASTSVLVRLIKLVRDYSFMVTLIAGVVAIHPQSMVWLLSFFAVVNGAFLAASVAKDGVTAWRTGARVGDTGLGQVAGR